MREWRSDSWTRLLWVNEAAQRVKNKQNKTSLTRLPKLSSYLYNKYYQGYYVSVPADAEVNRTEIFSIIPELIA